MSNSFFCKARFAFIIIIPMLTLNTTINKTTAFSAVEVVKKLYSSNFILTGRSDADTVAANIKQVFLHPCTFHRYDFPTFSAGCIVVAENLSIINLCVEVSSSLYKAVRVKNTSVVCIVHIFCCHPVGTFII